MATQQIYTTNDSDTVDGTLRPGDLAPYSSDFTITDQYYTTLENAQQRVSHERPYIIRFTRTVPKNVSLGTRATTPTGRLKKGWSCWDSGTVVQVFGPAETHVPTPMPTHVPAHAPALRDIDAEEGVV